MMKIVLAIKGYRVEHFCHKIVEQELLPYGPQSLAQLWTEDQHEESCQQHH